MIQRSGAVKILVADDSRTNLAIITDALTKLGHDVTAVGSGLEAIASFQLHHPDLIILDVVMDGMDGFECAKKIRAINSDDWIPIIFLSASVDDVSVAKGIDSGGDDYLTKPCSDIILAAKIRAMERIADMRQKLFATTQKLYLMSSTDSLTGTFNRLQFDRSIKEIIAAADRYKHTSALLFIDLDNFKSINDNFGHRVGDLLLIEVTNRIKNCLKSNDFIARLGGDEFAVVLSELSDPSQAEDIAKKILHVMSTDYFLDGHYIKNGASIGIAWYPQSAKNHEDLILNADVAMYHAKSCGRNNYKCYSEELNEKYKKTISIEHSLKFAIERKEMYLSYQPIYNLSTKEIIGVETLLCWDHPTLGLISPNTFIPIAEETGMISEIGNWVIVSAFDQMSKWPLHAIKDFKCCINISTRQFNNDNFYNYTKRLLELTHVKPEQIEFELTETFVMTYSSEIFKDTINKLHDLGIHLSIDDFGTGYSSLIRLKHLPIKTLKIEKSFIEDAVISQNGAIIVSCLIALGKNLGMNVIAEGIETQKQLDFLIENGCEYGQGFLLSKALDKNQIDKLLREKANIKVT